MSSGINLLPQQTKNTAVILGKLQLIRGIAIIILFGVSFLSLAISLLIAFSPLPKLKQTESELLANMTALHPKIAKQMVLSERMTQVSKVISQRSDYGKTMELLQTILPPSVRIDEVKITPKDISVRFSSTSLATIDDGIQNVRAYNDKEKAFSRVTIESVSYVLDRAVYSAMITVIKHDRAKI